MAYLDESQVTATTENVVVAGFYGECSAWEALGREWKKALGQRVRLHLTEQRWNSKYAEKRVKRLLAALGPLPHAFDLTPIYGATRIRDYADMLSKDSDRIIFSGYVNSFAHILADLTLDLPPNASLRVVCEEQKRWSGIASQMFHVVARQMSRHPRNPWLDGFTTVPKDSTFATEPADYLAFAIGKFLDDSGSKKDLWCRPIFGNRKPEEFIRRRSRKLAREGVRIVMESSRMGRSIFESPEFEQWLTTVETEKRTSMKSLTRRFVV